MNFPSIDIQGSILSPAACPHASELFISILLRGDTQQGEGIGFL
jgi:hypothetical protein